MTGTGRLEHDLARRAGGGHRAGDRGRPGPGLRPARRPPGRPGRAGRRRPGQRCRGRARAAELRAALLSLLGSPALADKTWVTEQYDRHVRGDTVLAMPEDAGPDPGRRGTGLGVALATDGNGRYCLLDPYAGAQLALAEAYRNVAATGARAGRRDQLPELRLAGGPGRHVAVRRGRAGPRRRLRRARHPGDRRQRQLLQPDRGGAHPPHAGGRGARRARRRAAPGADRVLASRGARWCCSAGPRAEFGGSAWAQVAHGHLGGRPPDGRSGRRAGRSPRCSPRRPRAGLLDAAHDLSDGRPGHRAGRVLPGRGNGCRVSLPGDAFTFLFSESAARVVVAVRPGSEAEFAGCARRTASPSRHWARWAATAWRWRAASPCHWTSSPRRTRARCRPCSGEGGRQVSAGRGASRRGPGRGRPAGRRPGECRPGRGPRSGCAPPSTSSAPPWGSPPGPGPPTRTRSAGSACAPSSRRRTPAGPRPGGAAGRRDLPARPAGRPGAGQGGRGAGAALRGGAVHRGTPAHPGHAAERGRDRPGDLGRGWPPARPAWAEAVAAGKVRASGPRADLSAWLPLLRSVRLRHRLAPVVKPDGRLTDDIDHRDRPPRDACGVFGVWSPGEEVAKLAYFGLYALQHRGQESAGIAVSDGDPDRRLQGHGPGRPGVRRVRAVHAARPHRGRALPLLHQRLVGVGERPADLPVHRRRRAWRSATTAT